jgi:serine/threonine protein kinase, bacterial
MNDSAPASRAGTMFGHYRLTRLLGRGGFGEVYEAEDTTLNRRVALKLIAPAYSHDSAFRERLFREAMHAGRLHDLHVVSIHGWGEIDGQVYIDMRLVEGIDLSKILDRSGPLSPPRAVAIVRQIASALDAAHAEQMIHRDIKPANVLLTRDDTACLVDFGLASAATDTRLTKTGGTIGTFAYMAPERLTGAPVDHRADIYALACLLYECLTGSTPFASAEYAALIAAHLMAPVPRASTNRPGVPSEFDQVIACGMAKDPNHRYASAGDLALAAHHALTAPDRHRAENILLNAEAPQPPPVHGPDTYRRQAAPTVQEDVGPSSISVTPHGRAWTPSPFTGARPPNQFAYPPMQAGPPAVNPQQPTAKRRDNLHWIPIGVSAAVLIALIVVGVGLWNARSHSGVSSSTRPPPPASTSPSAASNADTQFLFDLTKAGVIVVKDRNTAINTGHFACRQLSSGATWGPLLQALAPPTDTGIAGGAGLDTPSGADEQVLVESAVKNYCPENSSKVPPGFN